jgi:hypothetical protein
VIYLEIGAVILLVALVSVSDLIYRRMAKGGHSRRRRRSHRTPGAAMPGAFRTHPQTPTRAPGVASSAAGHRPGGTDSMPSELVRVKLRSGRVMEGWRPAADAEKAPGVDDAFDLDVTKAFDPNGNPMSFPSDSFIVFSSQVERLEVLETSRERKRTRELGLDRGKTVQSITASISATKDAATKDRAPAKSDPTRLDESPAPGRSLEGGDKEQLGQVIQLPEPEVVTGDGTATTLAPAPERPQPAPPVRRLEPPPTAYPQPSREPKKLTRERRRVRPLMWVSALMIIVLLAIVGDGLYTFLSLSHALDSARGDLRRGSASLLAGHYQAAHAEYLNASSASASADGLQGRPAFWLASHLPLVNRDARALAALGQSSHLASQAGLDAIQAVRAMGSPSEGLAAAIYSHGQINLNASQRGEPFFVDIEDLLGKAYATLRAAPQPTLTPIQTALSLALDKITEAKDAIHKTRSLISALPSLFGRDQTRHYLLLFDNPSIPRGSGGPIDFFGIMTAKSGSLSVGEIKPVDALPQASAPTNIAPVWFRHRYAALGAFRSWEQTTQSPSFDTVAPIAQSLYKASTGTQVDGVIQMDAVAMGLMSRAVGALRQPSFDVAVNAKNAVRVLTHDVYLHFPQEADRDLYVAGLIEEVWKRVAKGEATAAELATALGDSSKGSHFAMFTSRKSDELALNQVGIGAGFSNFEPNVQMAATNNRTFSRIGYYMNRTISTVARLTRKGQAFVTTSVELHNSAPKNPAPELVTNVGSGKDKSDLSLILPLHTRVQRLSVGGELQRYDTGNEGINPRLDLPVIVEPGRTLRVVCSYVIPHAMDLLSEGGTFKFVTVPQATANPDVTSITVIPPEGFQVVQGGSVGGQLDGDSYVARDTTGGTIQLQVKLAPPP